MVSPGLGNWLVKVVRSTFALPTTAIRGRFAIASFPMLNGENGESMQPRMQMSMHQERNDWDDCPILKRRVSLHVFQGRTHVHTAKSWYCAVDDDHQCDLLGFLGQYV